MDEAGQPFEPPMKVFSPCRGDRLVARSARRILRKPVEASKERASPADVFCPEAPCPRATTPASRKCQTLIVPRQNGGITLRELFFFPILYRNSILPNLLLIEDMGDFPPSLLQAAADEPAMAAPGKALGAKDGGAAAGRHSF